VWIAILHFGVGIFLFPMIICNVLLLLRCPTIVSELEDVAGTGQFYSSEDVSTPGSNSLAYQESSDVGGNKILPVGGTENTGAVVQAEALVGGEVQQQPMGGQPMAAAEATGAPVMM
jgi:hypothetical protein